MTHEAEIAARERLEEVLHQREERLAFLLRLNDALRPLSDPVRIQELTVQLFAEYLRANRVAYSVIDGQDLVVTTSYDQGVAPFRGRWPTPTFGAALVAP